MGTIESQQFSLDGTIDYWVLDWPTNYEEGTATDWIDLEIVAVPPVDDADSILMIYSTLEGRQRVLLGLGYDRKNCARNCARIDWDSTAAAAVP